ncbi:pseudouridine synthase [Salisediminibacterium beveridgei]|uniref:Pseudouridine synthase n=1 Tax=Salisediminibacterium beveridgei TaxID=632773 RepID=A0A1D7QSX3_9BACI|nr:pseudouridine synthase [Salisediminibacterium beveridgei]AOM82116.1 Ribosomal small subunit pseudouridine synthase A [Salisediminibacterium beveridgei]
MRVDKLLSHLGYGSRKDVKYLLKKGLFSVNGQTVKEGKVHVNPEEDELVLSGEPLHYRPYIYLMMNKPPGVLSATEDQSQSTVVDLLTDEDKLFEPFPVGRLDKDTTGLLLLTNDGKWAHSISSPKRKVEKTYQVQLAEPVTETMINALESGVILDDGYQTLPGKVVIPDADSSLHKVHLSIQEGKYHQVKRMFAAVGNHVRQLKRIEIGNVTLDPTLQQGEYRELSAEEIFLSGQVSEQ